MRPSIAAATPFAAGLAAAVVLAAVLLAALPFIRIADNAARDLMLTTVSPWTKPPDGIVLVTVTEETLATFPYRSPIDRAFLATILARMLEGAPRAVALDILFDQPTEPEKDEKLRAVLKGAGDKVVIAWADETNGLTPGQSAYLAAFAAGLKVGTADIVRDRSDGTVRTLSTGHRRNGHWIDSLPAALAKSRGAAVPADFLPMTYYRAESALPFAFVTYPAHAVPLLPAPWFRDKLVLIGADLPASDRHRTPFALLNGPERGALAGLAVHAHALAQLVAGDRLSEAGPLRQGLALAVLSALALLTVRAGIGPHLRILLVLALLAGVWGGAFLLLRATGFLLPPVVPSLAVVTVAGLAATHVWYRDRRQRRFIEGAFSHYVSPAYVKTLIAHPENLRLGGERQEATFVFTDIAGFTGLAEDTDPQVLSLLLNRYLDGLCGLFLEHGGTIDKIIGDAVVGFFGAPVSQPDHAERAVALMLAVDAFSEAFRREQEGLGRAMGATRAGAHCGSAIIGNFGGTQFFNYTGLGDTVNTAARLEGANKYFGTRICVSGAVAEAAPGHRFRPIGKVVLKGKSQPVEVLQPLNAAEAAGALVAAYGDAYARLAARDPGALAAFERLALDWPDDPLATFHLGRLRRGETGSTIALSEK
jgi:adenylate cyclase